MGLPPIDWSRPWLAPYRERGAPIAARVSRGARVAEALNDGIDGVIELAAGAMRFAGHDALPRGEAYETFIARSACVPTRDDLHDFFNGLVWLHRPLFKRRLNELHADAIARDGVRATRSSVRDVLTLIDENGALIEAGADVIDALRAHDWRWLFVDGRERWRREVRVTLIGHALLAKLVAPYKSITAHVWVGGAFDVDALAARPLASLPVLGVPGWWPANTAPAFYDDAAVFRPWSGHGETRCGTAGIRPAGTLRSTGSARRCRS
jgi:hypothetical protein